MKQCIGCITIQPGMKKVFAGKIQSSYQWYFSKDGVGHYAINSLLFLTTAREKIVKMYERFIDQLKCMLG